LSSGWQIDGTYQREHVPGMRTAVGKPIESRNVSATIEDIQQSYDNPYPRPVIVHVFSRPAPRKPSPSGRDKFTPHVLTIREHKGNFRNLPLCYFGDGNNVTNSLIVAALKVQMAGSVATSKGYVRHSDVINFARNNAKFFSAQSPASYR
jgi:hypothetical protein